MSARNLRFGDALGVWANSERVGTWSVSGGEHRFLYDDQWIASPATRRLSLSLPFTPGNNAHRGDAVRNFFDNLLPDSDVIRRRWRDKFSTNSTGTFDLLAAIGRDCAGAVQLLPPGVAPEGFDRIESRALKEADIEAAIDGAVTGASTLDTAGSHRATDDLRLAIAGAQEKTALLWHRRRWHRPLGTTPTSSPSSPPNWRYGCWQPPMVTRKISRFSSRVAAAFI